MIKKKEEIDYEIMIKNTEEWIENKIIYFITKNEKFGLKIVEETKNKISKNTEIDIKEISESKEKIKRLIDLLVNNQNDISQMQYIIDDFIKSNNYILN